VANKNKGIVKRTADRYKEKHKRSNSLKILDSIFGRKSTDRHANPKGDKWSQINQIRKGK